MTVQQNETDSVNDDNDNEDVENNDNDDIENVDENNVVDRRHKNVVEEVELEHDAYTIIFVAGRSNIRLFLYGFLVVMIQAFIALLIIIAQWYIPFPATKDDADTKLLIAQVTALCIFVLTNDDVSLSLRILMQWPTNIQVVPVPSSIGSHDDQNENPNENQNENQNENPNENPNEKLTITNNTLTETIQRFYDRPNLDLRLSILCINIIRLTVGLLVLAASFFFIVQAETILDVFLNYAAVTFINELDDCAFTLVERGFIGSRLCIEVLQMKDIRISFTENCCVKLNKRFYAMLSVLLLLIISWVLILVTDAGDPAEFIIPRENISDITEPISCGHIEVDFGNEVYNNSHSNGELNYFHFANFSGEYIDTVLEYRELSFTNDTYQGMFYYCFNLTAWVFTVTGNESILSDIIPDITKELCGDDGWLIQSPKIEEYSLINVPQRDWIFWNGTYAMRSDISLKCIECKVDSDCGIVQGICNTTTNTCDCKDGFKGHFCLDKDKDFLSS